MTGKLAYHWCTRSHDLCFHPRSHLSRPIEANVDGTGELGRGT